VPLKDTFVTGIESARLRIAWSQMPAISRPTPIFTHRLRHVLLSFMIVLPSVEEVLRSDKEYLFGGFQIAGPINEINNNIAQFRIFLEGKSSMACNPAKLNGPRIITFRFQTKTQNN
jgi:hypothetical protein